MPKNPFEKGTPPRPQPRQPAKKPVFKGATLGDLGPLQRMKEEMAPKQRENNKRIFNEVLKGRYDRIENKFGFTPTRVPGVEYVSLVTSDNKKSLYAIVYYRTPKGQEAHVTFAFSTLGTLMTPTEMPSALKGISLDDLTSDILGQVLEKDVGGWAKTDIPLNTVIDDELPLKKGEGEINWRPDEEDAARIRFQLSQPGLLFHALNEAKGFAGYRLFMYRNCCVLEHPMTNHAAYVVPFEGHFDPTYTKEKLLRLTKEERDALIKSIKGSERIMMTRSEKIAAGCDRVVHNASGSWKERMAELIHAKLSRLPPEMHDDQKRTP